MFPKKVDPIKRRRFRSLLLLVENSKLPMKEKNAKPNQIFNFTIGFTPSSSRFIFKTK